jgi:serine protease AprX
MKNPFIIIFLLLTCGTLSAQPLTKHWVRFADKKASPYSIDKPEAFLSPRAIERRKRYNIAIEENDLPVNPEYIEQLEAIGCEVYTTSKWFNATTVYCTEGMLAKVRKLPFVISTEEVGRFYKKNPKRTRPKVRDQKAEYYQKDKHYGFGRNQIKMLNGDILHKMGYDGTGMLVAILDGGFSNVDIMPFFDTLRATNRIMEGRDLVDNDDYVYESSSHGSQVLSTMAANLPGMFIGTAPGATYVCIKTEDVRSELRIEEDNWVAGAEYADSLGVDVINSSLGYTTFNIKSMSHEYKDLDGNTSRATIGADIAASKGLLIVVSAGNEGNGSWKYVGAPADADSVMAVGALDMYGDRVGFSSQGPTADGRVKPSVMARGGQSVVGSLYAYKVDSVDGTSFASPIMAGMVTSLWQAFPNKTNMEIIQAIERSSDRYDSPDRKYGHGTPDFYKAYRLLEGEGQVKNKKKERPGMVKRSFVETMKIARKKGKTVRP